jgi:hypothetical protein
MGSKPRRRAVNRGRRLTFACISLGITSLITLGLSHLALTDIGHGEGDLSLEWNILRISAAVLTAFIISTFVTLRASARARPPRNRLRAGPHKC